MPVGALVGEFFGKTGAHQGRPRDRLHRRRRSSAWAPRAASSSTSRTAARAARSAWPRCRSSSSARPSQSPKLAHGATRSGAPNVPQLYVDVDREKAKSAGRAARRDLQHARRDARHLLRQRLQQVRPHLAGADVGRAGPAQAPRRRRRGLRAQREGRDGPAALARAHRVHQRPGHARRASTTCRR